MWKPQPPQASVWASQSQEYMDSYWQQHPQQQKQQQHQQQHTSTSVAGAIVSASQTLIPTLGMDTSLMKIPVCVMGEKPVNDCPQLESPQVFDTDPCQDVNKKDYRDTDLVDDVFDEPDNVFDQSEQDTDFDQETNQPTLEPDDLEDNQPVPPPRTDSHTVRYMVDSINMDEKEEHFNWSKQSEYLLACIGFVNGLGSLLRLTTLTLKHGGGIFFVAYVLLMVVCGCPLVYLETALGQFAHGGPVVAWGVVPLFQGLGYSMLIITFLISSYYIVEVTWAMYYLGVSVISSLASYPLPWTCPNNTDNSYCQRPTNSNFTKFYLILNKNLPPYTVDEDTVQCRTDAGSVFNVGENCTSQHTGSSLVGMRYFYEEVLYTFPTVDGFGSPLWYLVLCLLLGWVTVFCCLLYGPKSIGKVMYVTALFPYLVMPVLFVFCCFLDGSLDGVKFFLNLRWQKLGNPQLWTDAVWLMVYSLGLGTGCLSTLAGYTHFHSHCFRNLLLICMANGIGMMVAGFTICSALGVYAADFNTTIQSLTLTEYDVGFAIFPYVLTRMSPPWLFTILYFLAVIIVGLDSLLVYIQNMVGGILEIANKYEISCSRRSRWMVQFILCLVLFLIDLIFTTRGGIFIVDFFNKYVGRIASLIIVVMECCILMYIFGAHKFTNNIADMTGNKDSPWWHCTWKFITPCTMSGLVLLSLITTEGWQYKGESYPPWTVIVGWAIMLSPLLCIPVTLLFCVISRHGSLKQRIKGLMYTPQFWGRGLVTSQDPNNGVPDYVICHPDTHRPAHGLAMLTANLYIPNLASLEQDVSQGQPESTSEMTGGYLSDLMTVTSTDSTDSDSENKERGNWRGKIEFVLSCLGYVVGLGNIWRFPYLVYRNGGGAFFIPYLVMLLFCGFPLVYMEMAFGQYASLGPVTIWRAVPLFKGVGQAMVLASIVVSVYYNMVNAWAFHYLFNSFFSTLPWSTCDNEWNTERCQQNQYQISNCSWIDVYKLSALSSANITTDTTSNSSCLDLLLSCATKSSNDTGKFQLHNITACVSWAEDTIADSISLPNKSMNLSFTSPSHEYFYNSVLKQSSGLGDFGAIQWPLALYLLLCWAIVFLCLVKGIYSSGKVAYFVVITPIILLLVVLICALMVEGHLEGIKFYVTPKWDKILQPKVWSDAASQVFFSLSVCMGGLTTLSSYNKFRSNIYRDALVICLVDTLISILSGFTVFASLGILSHQLNTTVENVVDSNIGLLFVAIPSAVTNFEPSAMWSFFFFLMIILMGMSTIMTMTETIVTAIIDENVKLLRKWRILVLFVTCFVLFLLGLPLTSQGGIYIIQFLDEFCGGIPPIVIGIFMCMALSWVYGVKRFCSDINHMIQRPVSVWWKIMWCFTTPLIIMFILLSAILAGVDLDPKHFPSWSESLGIVLSILPVCTIPLLAIHKIVRADGDIIQRVRRLCKPGKTWGPALEKHWNNVEYYPAVNTHTLSVDMEQSPVHTVSDNVVFTTSGMKVPNIPDTNLISSAVQMSPSLKKPQDIRQKAILNHAYSNPQCSVSNVSIDKLPKTPSSVDTAVPHQSDVMIVSKKFNNTRMKNVSIQTDASSFIRALWRARLLASAKNLSSNTGTIPRDSRSRGSVNALHPSSKPNSLLDISNTHRSKSVNVLPAPGGRANTEDRLQNFSSSFGDPSYKTPGKMNRSSSALPQRGVRQNSMKSLSRMRKQSDDTEVRKRTLNCGKRVLSRQNSDPYETLGAHGGISNPAGLEEVNCGKWGDEDLSSYSEVFADDVGQEVVVCEAFTKELKSRSQGEGHKLGQSDSEDIAQVLHVIQGNDNRQINGEVTHADADSRKLSVTQF